MKKNLPFSFLSFSIVIKPILIILDVLKSSWTVLSNSFTFVHASAIVTDYHAITPDGPSWSEIEDHYPEISPCQENVQFLLKKITYY